MLKADRTLSYNFIASKEPTNIIQESKVIPLFIFEYLVQENMSPLTDQALE